jgi:alpha-beta hydrolase superfamily lysophospholipase
MQDLPESTLSPFTAGDGENLAVRDWPLPARERRGTVLVVHGLGEHSARYRVLAARLNGWGFAVRSYDHYGHGESGGPRGGLTSDLRLEDDLADLVDATRARMRPGEPVEALVLSSPALAAFLNPVQKLLLATLPRLVPNLRVGNGLDADFLSHDADVVAAYRADRRCHDRICARLARYIADAGPATVAHAPQWSVPTLLLWGEDDRIVDPAGSQVFAAAAPQDVLAAQGFAGLYHEIFNEREAQPVFTALGQWLGERF